MSRGNCSDFETTRFPLMQFFKDISKAIPECDRADSQYNGNFGIGFAGLDPVHYLHFRYVQSFIFYTLKDWNRLWIANWGLNLAHRGIKIGKQNLYCVHSGSTEFFS